MPKLQKMSATTKLGADEPSPPTMLDARAAEKWRKIVASGRHIRNLDVLQAYCVAYSRWIEMEEWLANPEHGLIATIRDDKGNVKSHGPAPQLAISERSSKEMTRLGKALGLNS